MGKFKVGDVVWDTGCEDFDQAEVIAVHYGEITIRWFSGMQSEGRWPVDDFELVPADKVSFPGWKS